MEEVGGEDVQRTGRRTRWGPLGAKQDWGELPTELPAGLTEGQVRSYTTYIRLEEINRRLRTGHIRPTFADGEEGLSDDHYRGRLEEERAILIERTLRSTPEYSCGLDYNTWLERHMSEAGASAGAGPAAPPSTHGSGANAPEHGRDRQRGNTSVLCGGVHYKYSERVWIPQLEYPEINFIGLLIGPRGNTLKKMESESLTKISIRGKGSIKDGGIKGDGSSTLASAEEDLHALVMGDSHERIEKAMRIINKIIETAASIPEESNELKRVQLRELASLNGTLREEDSIMCSNCGQLGHRRFECVERRNITNSTICRICGGAGHIAADCMHREDPQMLLQSQARSQQMNEAYKDFLADIGDRQDAGADPSV